jgi:thymidylate synthase (FAD)
MAERKKILDHGYVELVESWGSDERIIEAARMSTGKGFLGWLRLIRCPNCGFEIECENKPAYCNQNKCVNVEMVEVHPGDRKLLRFLWENKHSSPFEMPGMTIEVAAPIMVFREWHRHRVPWGYNEMSARYTPLPDVNYTPTVERLMVNSKTNKQAGTIKGAGELTPEVAEEVRSRLATMWMLQEELYQWELSVGVPKELARIHLGVGRYSRMRATSNLRGWLAFLTLRMAPAAQFEIRQFANAAGELIAKLFPRTWALFVEKKT